MALTTRRSAAFAPDFMPHGFCFLWNPEIVWLHAISDVVIRRLKINKLQYRSAP